jgi:DNA-binding NarL/FixJ family response regulator
MSQHPSTPDPDTVRVLVVDDSEDMRFLVRWAVERDGSFTVVAEAADGHEAVLASREHQPDLVLLDISMPGMNGLEALPRIREQSPTSVVVMLSTFAPDHEQAVQAIALGADGYLHKTKESHLLPDQVHKILNAAGR